ncbi:MAG: transcription elongation factor GreAB [Opitutales bacterium]
MEKASILSAIMEELEREVERCRSANKSAASGATDSESRAESKWDTQGLESSYLARGYARQFEQLLAQAETLRGFKPDSFKDRGIGLGALVKCDLDGFTSWFFLLPSCGGMDVDIEGTEVTIISQGSPIGQALSGKRKGDRYKLPDGPGATILSVE